MTLHLRGTADPPMPSTWREVAPGQWVKELDDRVTVAYLAKAELNRLMFLGMRAAIQIEGQPEGKRLR